MKLVAEWVASLGMAKGLTIWLERREIGVIAFTIQIHGLLHSQNATSQQLNAETRHEIQLKREIKSVHNTEIYTFNSVRGSPKPFTKLRGNSINFVTKLGDYWMKIIKQS